jgi:hypothetical protein
MSAEIETMAPVETAMARRTALFRANLAAMRGYSEEIYMAMNALREPVMRITGAEETGDLNIDLGHTLFYVNDAASFAREQLDLFWQRPDRFYIDPPPSPPPSTNHSFALSEDLYAYLRANDIRDIAPDASNDAGYLVIFGIGLGLHLPELFEKAEVRYFIMAEEFGEFLYHSMHVIDWAKILDGLKARKQTLRMFFGTEPRQVHAKIHWYMRGEGFGLLDGSFTYRHYRSLLLDGVHAQFIKDLPLLPVSDGFFEDEQVMMHNCGANLAWYEHYLLDVRPRLAKDVAVFIVGSGPSFNKTVETVRAWRDRAIVISCGTGLTALLKSGIRPDFHCELENVLSSYVVLKWAEEHYGSLKDITLIASTTVWAEMTGMFRRAIYFFRDSVSSTKMWCGDGDGLYGMAPTVTNLAIRASLVMGFRQLYLFGVDLGTRDARVQHSDASIYTHQGAWNQGSDDPVRAMTIPMPANFGGGASTNTILHWARMLMIQSLEPFPYAHIYNCSDGVRIDGTIPKLAHTVRLDTTTQRRDIVLERLFSELLFKRAGEAIDIEQLTALRRRCTSWRDAFLALIERAKTEEMGFVPFYEATIPLLDEDVQAPFQRVIHAMYIGTMMMCFQTGYYFYRRVGEDRKQGLMNAFLDALAHRLTAMHRAMDADLYKITRFATDLDHMPEHIVLPSYTPLID